MKEIVSRILPVLLVSAGLDLIYRYPANLEIALAAEWYQHLQPVITTSELIVGENRFAFGLVKANKLLENAHVQLELLDRWAGIPPSSKN